MLTEKSCAEFTEALADRVSVPGGGGAAALAAALSVSLGAMAGNYTLSNESYADVAEDMAFLLSRTETLRLRLLELVEADAAAFEPLSRAYAIPKEDPARGEILEDALQGAIDAPMEILSRCCEAAVLFEELEQKGSRMLLSDVGCAALLCRAAMECAALNVFVNTRALRDRQEAAEIDAEVDDMLLAFLPRLHTVAEAVTRRLRGRS